MAIQQTAFQFKHQTNYYKGKVRDVYSIAPDLLVMIVSDRISAFDVILPEPIPYKGQLLNEIALFHLSKTKDIMPNWVIASPHPNVTIGKACEPIKIEMVVRGYLAGSAWRAYKNGIRTICGVSLPEGLVENQALEKPIITPTTKASIGHDEEISKEEIIAQGITTKQIYEQMVYYEVLASLRRRHAKVVVCSIFDTEDSFSDFRHMYYSYINATMALKATRQKISSQE